MFEEVGPLAGLAGLAGWQVDRLFRNKESRIQGSLSGFVKPASCILHLVS
ncbi:hypothetical protein D3OALGB2SA_4966 [Olavius algarvensis associated proteobacterium Delta 3]|nr:hypothetical protein D3OALGB2SA_4966 [Olavius algarvensis associated proteobacterium Delta 3]